jgi:hypothetical protein
MAEVVLHLCRMRHTITVRLPAELAEWLEERKRQTGWPAGRIIRHQLERARSESGSQRFLQHAGKISGPRNLSSRKGFAPS